MLLKTCLTPYGISYTDYNAYPTRTNNLLLK